MALTAEQRKKLEKLSIENEGLSFVKKSLKATKVPTIVIGLGGMGCETLNILKGKVKKNLGNPKNIKFLAVDSDETDLVNYKKSISEEGHLEDGETLSLYDPGITELLINHGINRPPYTYEWMRKDFPEVRIANNGAQGTRQIGRVILTCGSAYSNIQARIAAMVNSASASATDTKSFEIILIAGISGGTGSGTIIDISYLVHRVMEQEHRSNYNFSAYVYTPDVQFSVVGINNQPAIMNNLKRNGYAAMKEIDYFMNLENHHGEYSINVGGAGSWSSSRNIFTACTIVSGIIAQGMNTKKSTMENLTENLLDLLSNIEMKGQNGNVQMANSFSSNKRESVSSWYNSMGNDPQQFPKEANYVYQMLGYSAVSIPKDEIIAYCINKLFQAVYDEFKAIHAVDGDMVRTILSRAYVSDADTLADYALSLDTSDPVQMNVTLQQNEYPSKNEVRNGSDATFAMCVQYAQFEANKITAPAFRTRLKTEIYNSLTRQIDEIFDNYGPYYVVELLTHTADKVMAEDDRRQPFAGVLEELHKLQTELLDLENGQRTLANGINIQTQLQNLRAAASGFMAGRDKMKAYVDFNGQIAVSSVINTTLYHTLSEIVQEVSDELVRVNNGIWEVYTDVLTEISRILEKDSQAVTSAEKHQLTYTYNVLNLYEVTDKSKKLKKYLEDFVSPQAIDTLSSSFIRSMRDKREEWTALNNADHFDVVTEVQTIFDELMNSVLGTDVIEKFVVAAYSPNQLSPSDIDRIWETNGKEKEEALKSAANEIFNILNTKGGLMANLDTGYTQGQFLNKKLIVKLDDTPGLSHELKVLYGNEGKGNTEIGTSKGLSKYILSTIVYCVPVYLFDGFMEYDKVYRSTIDSIGLHMDEVKQNFRRFPQPFIIDIAAKKGEDYEDFDDYKILMEVKNKADKAIEEYGFIEESINQGCYVLYNVTKKPKDLDQLKDIISGMLEDEDTDITLKGAMEKAGYRFETVLLTMAFNALDPLDREGAGRYVEIGDFYKLLRMSVRYMTLLDENIEIWGEAKAVYDKMIADYQIRIQYSKNLLIFANAIKAGLVKDEGRGIWSYSSRGSKEILIDLRTDTPFDRKYIMYNAFSSFSKLRPEILEEMRKTAKKAITGDEDTSVIKDTLEEILEGDDYLGDIFAKDDIREDVAASERDYSFTDKQEIARNPYSVLKRFYTSLRRLFK